MKRRELRYAILETVLLMLRLKKEDIKNVLFYKGFESGKNEILHNIHIDEVKPNHQLMSFVKSGVTLNQKIIEILGSN